MAIASNFTVNSTSAAETSPANASNATAAAPAAGAAPAQDATAAPAAGAAPAPAQAAALMVSTDIYSDPICHSAGCTQYLFPKPNKSEEYPMDYPVPHFGIDQDDVATTFNSLAVAEKIRNHRWSVVEKPPKPEDPVLYDDKPELDSDIQATHQHVQEIEESIKKA
jgi:hypothetical protein